MIKDLAISNRDGRTSTTKFWYNIACATSTAVVIWYAYNLKLDWTIFGLYLGCVGGFSAASKFLAYKYEGVINDTNSPTVVDNDMGKQADNS